MKQIFYGYMRVSSSDQNMERQRMELLSWGIEEKRLFADRLSGRDFARPNYQKLRKKLKRGDVLVVKSIDRLGRNYEEILKEWRYIVKELEADIVILDMPLLDTRVHRDLTGTLIADIVLQLLSYVAQTERDYIRQRQAEGIAVARAKGVHLGRRKSPFPKGFEDYYQRWRGGTLSFAQMKQALGLTENQLRWFIRRRNRDMRLSRPKNFT